jgi:protoporphyrinogen oxidase
MTSNIIVAGSGMAGLGAAYRLNINGLTPVIYDKNNYIGGNTASFRYDNGFIFDLGPHISFTKDQRIQNLLAENVENRFEEVQVMLNNYWQGYWPKHPVQLHLCGLPEDIIVKVIADFVAESHSSERAVKNYADWLISNLGRTFAEQFPMKYTRKYHLTTAENMSTDWLGPRMYRPTLEEMLHGALSTSSPNIHYITDFRYPTEGGFDSYLNKFVPMAEVNLRHELVSIDPGTRRLDFSNGTTAYYEALISSIPLPELVSMINEAPGDVVDAAHRLACSTCVLVNIGVKRTDLSASHMTYFYDEDFCFSRLSFPHMLSSNNTPQGTGSVQAEVYFSQKYKPLTNSPDDWIDRVTKDLHRCGILHEDDVVLFKNAILVPYANIIFDLERANALQKVHSYLDDVGINYCGRYGDWGYLWTDEAFKSGENAAQKVLARLT